MQMPIISNLRIGPRNQFPILVNIFTGGRIVEGADGVDLRQGSLCESYAIPVILVSVGRPCDSHEHLLRVITFVLQSNGCRTLWPFEALTLNHYDPNLQMSQPFATQDLAFGVRECDLHKCPDRSQHGHVLSTLQHYSEFGSPRHLMIAATPMTAVDVGLFDDRLIERDWEQACQRYG